MEACTKKPATTCVSDLCEMSTSYVEPTNNTTPVSNDTTPSTPDLTQDHCELKSTFKQIAASSGVTGAGGVCYGVPKNNCLNVDQCEWIIVTPVEDPTNSTNTTDSNTNSTTPVDPTPIKPSTPVVLPSEEVGKCTHTTPFNENKTITDLCAKMEEKECLESMFADSLKDKKNPPRCVFNQCSLTAIAGAKPACNSDSKCSLYSDNFPGHGFCNFLKDAPPSTEIGVCTHNPNFDQFATVIN